MSRLTRFTTTRLRNRLRRPWAIRPSILRGGLEMAPALPPRRTTVDARCYALGDVALGAPALPPRRTTVDARCHALGDVALGAPALPPRRTTVDARCRALGDVALGAPVEAVSRARAAHEHWPAGGLGRAAAWSWDLG